MRIPLPQQARIALCASRELLDRSGREQFGNVSWIGKNASQQARRNAYVAGAVRVREIGGELLIKLIRVTRADEDRIINQLFAGIG